jgi:acetyltransferase-like isoleucine patch superfamily enzyme
MMTNSTRSFILRRLATLYRDPRGSITFTLDNFLQSTQMYFDTAWCRLVAYMWGVNLGSSCRFIGKTHFRRYPGSLIKIEKNCEFRSSFRSNMVGLNRPCGLSTYHKNAEIRLGKNCGLSGVIIGAANSIVLGNNVLCGANVTITDFDWHNINPANRHESLLDTGLPVLINDNVWLGLNTLILKGIEIGKNTVVGANSVVTSSIPENVLAAGVPARVIRSLI